MNNYKYELLAATVIILAIIFSIYPPDRGEPVNFISDRRLNTTKAETTSESKSPEKDRETVYIETLFNAEIPDKHYVMGLYATKFRILDTNTCYLTITKNRTGLSTTKTPCTTEN